MSERRGDTIEGKIRGVRVRWDRVLIAGHVVEMTLSYRIAEAEQVYGKRWDDELDRHLQMGMFAMDRISADGTMGKAAAAEPRSSGPRLRTCLSLQSGGRHRRPRPQWGRYQVGDEA